MKDAAPDMPEKEDACPRSAVGHGVGLAGLAGLAVWTAIAWRYGMDGPHAGIAAVFACGLPMVLWSLFVDKVHHNPSTGIDWAGGLRTNREALDISVVKLAGLWATGGAIAAAFAALGGLSRDELRATRAEKFLAMGRKAL